MIEKYLRGKLENYKIEKLKKLINLILKWNKKINITGLKTEEEIFDELIYDSLSPYLFAKDYLKSPLIDAGCGAGFPSVVLKIADESLNVIAVDSNRKKINFLKYAIRELSLSGITAVRERIENLATKIKANTITSKAFMPYTPAKELLMPFLYEGGYLIYFASERFRHPEDSLIYINYTLPISGKRRKLAILKRQA